MVLQLFPDCAKRGGKFSVGEGKDAVLYPVAAAAARLAVAPQRGRQDAFEKGSDGVCTSTTVSIDE